MIGKKIMYKLQYGIDIDGLCSDIKKDGKRIAIAVEAGQRGHIVQCHKCLSLKVLVGGKWIEK